MNQQPISQRSERELIAQLTADTPAMSNPYVHCVVGNGDDAAAFTSPHPMVISTDMFIEDRHFTPRWASWNDIGHKAIIQAFSDIEAMAAVPAYCTIALSVPPTMLWEDFQLLASGLTQGCQRTGATIAGGDLSRSTHVFLSITAVGYAPQPPIGIATVQPGDIIALSGSVGQSAAGLDSLLTGRSDPTLQRSHHIPAAAVGVGITAHQAHALTDISDSLVQECYALATASALTLTVQSAQIPIEDSVRAYAPQRALEFALHGGEDYRLLAAFDPTHRIPEPFTAIGVAEAGDAEVRVDGQPVSIQGWDAITS